MKRIPVVEIEEYVPDEDETPEKLAKAREWIMKWGGIITIVLILAWPIAAVPWGVFPRSIFALWSSIAVMLGTLATVVIIGLPIWESRDDLLAVCTGILGVTPPSKPTKMIETTVGSA
jgi:membrane protein YdbS with pleckstrin-like domain